MVRAAFAGEDLAAIRHAELVDAADAVQDVIDRVDLDKYATSVAQHPQRRLAYIGARDSAGTAEFAALITKESAKVAAEGYVGGQFRHGPFELAGDGLTVMVFAPERDQPDASLRRLAADLVDTGSQVDCRRRPRLPGHGHRCRSAVAATWPSPPPVRSWPSCSRSTSPAPTA